MSAVFDVGVIAGMSNEAKLRNLCRQLEWSARIGQEFGYKGRPVRYATPCLTGLYAGFSILKGGRGPNAWVALEKDCVTITARFVIREWPAAKLYAALASAIESNGGEI